MIRQPFLLLEPQHLEDQRQALLSVLRTASGGVARFCRWAFIQRKSEQSK